MATSARKSCLIIFDHPLSLRSYFETGLVGELSKKLDLHFLILSDSSFAVDLQKFMPEGSKVEFLILNGWCLKILALYNNSYWLKKSSKSLSFTRRVSLLRKKQKTGFWNYLFLKFIQIVGLKVLISVVNILVHPKLILAFQKLGEAAAYNTIYVSSGGSLALSDCLVSLKSKQNKSLGVIVENWDNISSKSVFLNPPFLLGVWGNQGAELAAKIHSFPVSRIRVIGNPRTDWLRDKIFRDYPKDSVLFAGGSVDIRQELKYIELCRDFCINKGIRFVYLPHPKSLNIVNEFIERGVLVEDQIIGLTRVDSDFGGSLPRINEYILEYSRARFLVSSFSTMNLEASALGIPSVAIDLLVDVGNYKKKKLTECHDHLKYLPESKCMLIASNVKEFMQVLESFSENQNLKEFAAEMKESSKFFLDNEPKFIFRLESFIDELTKENKP